MREPKAEKRRKGAGFYTVVIAGVLVLYALSMGPAYGLAVRFDVGGNSFVVLSYIYWPVVWLNTTTGGMLEPLMKWVRWWMM